MKDQTEKMRLEDCAPSFQSKINEIAVAGGLTKERVFELWLKYSGECLAGDQSAVMFEFEQWYAKELAVGTEAIASLKELFDWARSNFTHTKAIILPSGRSLHDALIAAHEVLEKAGVTL